MRLRPNRAEQGTEIWIIACADLHASPSITLLESVKVGNRRGRDVGELCATAIFQGQICRCRIHCQFVADGDVVAVRAASGSPTSAPAPVFILAFVVGCRWTSSFRSNMPDGHWKPMSVGSAIAALRL